MNYANSDIMNLSKSDVLIFCEGANEKTTLQRPYTIP
jgi:hypothetical protein